jgi:hypothetical protein
MTDRRFSGIRNWKTKVLFTALCCTMLPVSIMAEDFAAANTQGSKALLFTFDGLATLLAKAYDGTGIGAGVGGKYYLMDPLALRASLIFVTASQKLPAQTSPGTDGSNSGTTFGITGGAEYHLLKGRVSPYAGGAIGFSTTSTKREEPIEGAGTQTTTTENAAQTIGGFQFTPGFSFLVAGIGGIEFFIIKDLSLGAEYQLGLFLNSPYDTKRTTPPNTVTTKNGATSAIGIRGTGTLTLAVYF